MQTFAESASSILFLLFAVLRAAPLLFSSHLVSSLLVSSLLFSSRLVSLVWCSVKQSTDLPQDGPSLGRTQRQYPIIEQADAVNALGEGDQGLLLACVPRVDVDDRLVRLCGEDVGGIGRQAVGPRRALLEGGRDGGDGLQFVHVDAIVLGDGGVGWLALGQDCGDEAFGQHDRGWMVMLETPLPRALVRRRTEEAAVVEWRRG